MWDTYVVRFFWELKHFNLSLKFLKKDPFLMHGIFITCDSEMDKRRKMSFQFKIVKQALKKF